MSTETIRISRNSLGEIVLERDGEDPRAVKPVRALPLTDPDDWIGLMDEKGKPVHMVRSLAELDEESRAVLTQELERVYFLPKIARIQMITEEYGVLRVGGDGQRPARLRGPHPRAHPLPPQRPHPHARPGRQPLRDPLPWGARRA